MRRTRLFPFALFAALCLTVAAPIRPALASVSDVFTVTSVSQAQTGCGLPLFGGTENEPSLWCALNDANASGATDTKTIMFATGGIYTPAAGSGWPPVSANNLTIDGYGSNCTANTNTQPITAMDTAHPDTATITVQLDKGASTAPSALDLDGTNQTICGLAITHFPAGITVEGIASGITLKGNFIGTAADGVTKGGNSYGIDIRPGASNVLVGGTAPPAMNLIGSGTYAVNFRVSGGTSGAGAGDVVQGNVIGLDKAMKPNGASFGIYVDSHSGITIGGTATGAGNIIMNNQSGIIAGSTASLAIEGNSIGATFTGSTGTQGYGIVFGGGGTATIGLPGDTAGTAANIIRNNTYRGVILGNTATDPIHVAVYRNSIFDNASVCSASTCLGNSTGFVYQDLVLYGRASDSCTAAGSVSPNNGIACPVITSASAAQITGTACANCTVDVYIATGSFADENHGSGRQFLGETSAGAGGAWNLTAPFATPFDPSQQPATATATDPAGNTSEYSANVGQSSAAYTTATTVDTAPLTPCQDSTGAFIGTRSLRCALVEANGGTNNTVLFGPIGSYVPSGTAETPLYGTGLALDGYGNNCATGANTQPVGGMDAAHPDNGLVTVRIANTAAIYQGLIVAGANQTVCGLAVTGFTGAGIAVVPGAVGPTLKGNYIGIAPDGTTAGANSDGIVVDSSATNVTIGGTTPDAVNIIANSSSVGLYMHSASTPPTGSGNQVLGNVIGLNRALAPAGNGTGVWVQSYPGLTIGGASAGAGNIISANGWGIQGFGVLATGIQSNAIGTTFTAGAPALGNSTGGISLQQASTGTVASNIVANNGTAGVLVGSSATDNSVVKISQNSIYNNTTGNSCIAGNPCLGVDLFPQNAVNCTGPTALAPDDYTPCPVINAPADTTQVSGTACDGCTVEVFIAQPDASGHSQGKTYLGSATAGTPCGSPPCSDTGKIWTLVHSGICTSGGCPYPSGALFHQSDFVTATATQSGATPETSEFAANKQLAAPTAARVTAFSAVHHGATLTVRWRLARSHDVLGFLLHTGTHRLTPHLIKVHRSPTYRYITHWTGHGHITLHILLSAGGTETVPIT